MVALALLFLKYAWAKTQKLSENSISFIKLPWPDRLLQNTRQGDDSSLQGREMKKQSEETFERLVLVHNTMRPWPTILYSMYPLYCTVCTHYTVQCVLKGVQWVCIQQCTVSVYSVKILCTVSIICPGVTLLCVSSYKLPFASLDTWTKYFWSPAGIQTCIYTQRSYIVFSIFFTCFHPFHLLSLVFTRFPPFSPICTCFH